MSTATTADEAKREVAACEKEIGAIKASLRVLGPADDSSTGATSSGSAGSNNCLTVAWTKMEGLPEAAEPCLTLQLSSPIEEAALTELYEDGQQTVSFSGVEMGQATLTVTCADADIPLGGSISYDLAELVQMDAMQPAPEYVNELAVAILPEGTEKSSSSSSEVPVVVAEAVCTVTLKLTYKPSPKDQREELYELLNKTTVRKARAVEKLRQLAMQAARSQVAVQASGTKPAVQAGFLNKKGAAAKEPHWAVEWYNRKLGPKVDLAKVILPIAKNYLIFFGAVGFFHFQGQALALPRPV